MQLIIVAVGHKMPTWVTMGFEEYTKRMPPEARILLKEIKPIVGANNIDAQTLMAQERVKIEAHIPSGAYVVALDEHGREPTSVQLSQYLNTWQQNGRDIVFVIGGANGLDAQFKKNADMLMRLSSLTLPHAAVRVILAEQLYRAWSITQNHPYHRA